MKKVVLEIIMFAIAIALVTGVIVVIANKAYNTGHNAKGSVDTIDANITTISTPVN